MIRVLSLQSDIERIEGSWVVADELVDVAHDALLTARLLGWRDRADEGAMKVGIQISAGSLNDSCHTRA